MICAERKPFEEIYACAKRHKKILITGCGTCVTVCMAGGDKEADVLASQIKLAAKERGDEIEVEKHTIVRQCDREFFDEEMTRKINAADAVISMACGVGVQYSAEIYPDLIVYPALNTEFFGTNLEQGVWDERCAGCGECILEQFADICPISRCSKSLLNGPCGGSTEGKCEIDPENVDCAWQLIFDRMKRLGRLDELVENQPMKDWNKGRDGGPRKIVRKDMKL